MRNNVSGEIIQGQTKGLCWSHSITLLCANPQVYLKLKKKSIFYRYVRPMVLFHLNLTLLRFSGRESNFPMGDVRGIPSTKNVV